MKSPAAIARALLLNTMRAEFDAWNARNKAARDEKDAHPITSLAFPCDCGFKVCRMDCKEDD